jgi:hypothetical protein
VPTNRRVVVPFARTIITPGMVDLWKRIKAIRYAAPDFAAYWDNEEFRSATKQLSLLLALPPWATEPDQAMDPEPPDWMRNLPDELEAYNKAHKLYLLLEQAAAEVTTDVKQEDYARAD